MKQTGTQHPTDDEQARLSIQAFKGIEVGLGQADPLAIIAQILDRAFTGFVALPAPNGKRQWREVMIFGESTPTGDQLKQRFRELASTRHPDKGDTDAEMSELNIAHAEAQREIQS